MTGRREHLPCVHPITFSTPCARRWPFSVTSLQVVDPSGGGCACASRIRSSIEGWNFCDAMIASRLFTGGSGCRCAKYASMSYLKRLQNSFPNGI